MRLIEHASMVVLFPGTIAKASHTHAQRESSLLSPRSSPYAQKACDNPLCTRLRNPLSDATCDLRRVLLSDHHGGPPHSDPKHSCIGQLGIHCLPARIRIYVERDHA